MALINPPPVRQDLPVTNDRAGWTIPWTEWLQQVFRICSAATESGTTANRPTVNLYVGRTFFDTTLNRPIWRNATNTGWIRADGVTV